MYKGQRDPMLGIIVPQDCCNTFLDGTGTLWIEVFIPPRDMRNMKSTWSSIMIPPNQVFYIDNVYNEIQVNAGAVLTCLFKEFDAKGNRHPVASETEITELVLGRFLQLEYYKRHGIPDNMWCIVDDIEKQYRMSGLKNIEFIRRCL